MTNPQTWMPQGGSSDIFAGTVYAGQIAAGAIGTAELAAGSITAEKIAAGAIVAGTIAAGSIVASDIAAGAITAEKLAVDSVTAGAIAAGAIGASEIAAGAIQTDKLAAGAITAEKIDVASLQAAVVTAAVVNALSISANAIKAGILDVARIDAGSIKASKLDVADVQAQVVTAAKVNTLTLNAVNITGGNISGINITGSTISGGTVNVNGSLIMGAGGVLRTASSGRRLELVNSPADAMKLWSAVYGEIDCGYVGTATWGSRGMVYIKSPYLASGYSPPYIFMGQAQGEPGAIDITGGGVSLGMGDVQTGVLDIRGDIRLAWGRIYPDPSLWLNWTGTSTDDGVWIGDIDDGRLWKLYVHNAGAGKKIYARRDSGTYIVAGA